MKVPGPWLIVSIAAHAAAAVLLVWAGAHVVSKMSGGAGGSGGEIVSVWVAGPSGTVVSGEGMARKSDMSSPIKSPPKDAEGRASFDAGKSAGTGDGTGGAAGTGAGRGVGSAAGSAAGEESALREIWKKIDRNKYYPAPARRRGTEGAPRVSFALDENGNVKWVKLDESCGNGMLDDAALETVRRAAPLPAYPHTITLSIKYAIDD